MAQSLENAASKGVAGTALGIGIGALGLQLLRGGFGGVFGRGLLGEGGCGCHGGFHGGHTGFHGGFDGGYSCEQLHRLPAA